MSKIKNINLVNIVIDCLFLIIVLVINYFLYFNKSGYSIATVMLSIVGVINLIFVCVKEASVMTYDTKRFTLVLHMAHILVGVGLHYIVKFIKGFYNVQFILWAILILLIITPIVFVYYLNKKDNNQTKTNSQTPKFVMNK